MENFIERQLQLRGGGEVTVRFSQPRQDGDDYRCEYQIDWPDRQRRFYGCGVDSVQALIGAMQNAHADLLSSAESRSGALSWLGQRELGLPLAEPLRPQDFSRPQSN
jgi:uncharacterized protein DUF6968